MKHWCICFVIINNKEQRQQMIYLVKFRKNLDITLVDLYIIYDQVQELYLQDKTTDLDLYPSISIRKKRLKRSLYTNDNAKEVCRYFQYLPECMLQVDTILSDKGSNTLEGSCEKLKFLLHNSVKLASFRDIDSIWKHCNISDKEKVIALIQNFIEYVERWPQKIERNTVLKRSLTNKVTLNLPVAASRYLPDLELAHAGIAECVVEDINLYQNAECDSETDSLLNVKSRLIKCDYGSGSPNNAKSGLMLPDSETVVVCNIKSGFSQIGIETNNVCDVKSGFFASDSEKNNTQNPKLDFSLSDSETVDMSNPELGLSLSDSEIDDTSNPELGLFLSVSEIADMSNPELGFSLSDYEKDDMSNTESGLLSSPKETNSMSNVRTDNYKECLWRNTSNPTGNTTAEDVPSRIRHMKSRLTCAFLRKYHCSHPKVTVRSSLSHLKLFQQLNFGIYQSRAALKHNPASIEPKIHTFCGYKYGQSNIKIDFDSESLRILKNLNKIVTVRNETVKENHQRSLCSSYKMSIKYPKLWKAIESSSVVEENIDTQCVITRRESVCSTEDSFYVQRQACLATSLRSSLDSAVQDIRSRECNAFVSRHKKVRQNKCTESETGADGFCDSHMRRSSFIRPWETPLTCLCTVCVEGLRACSLESAQSGWQSYLGLSIKFNPERHMLWRNYLTAFPLDSSSRNQNSEPVVPGNLYSFMQYEVFRLCTFSWSQFPTILTIFVACLAEYGFYYVTQRAEVLCFGCGSRFIGSDHSSLENANLENYQVRAQLESNLESVHLPECTRHESNKSLKVWIQGIDQERLAEFYTQYRSLTPFCPEESINLTDPSGNAEMNAPREAHQIVPSGARYTLHFRSFVEESLSQQTGSRGENLAEGGAVGGVVQPLELGHAAYPQFASVSARRQSFTKWNPQHCQRPDDLVAAGFFFAGYADCARCFFCGLGLKFWRPTDIPAYEHARYRPHCVYNRMYKGLEYIERVQEDIKAEQRVGQNEQAAVARGRLLEQTNEVIARELETEAVPRARQVGQTVEAAVRPEEQTVVAAAGQEEQTVVATARQEEQTVVATARQEEQTVVATARQEEQTVVAAARQEEQTVKAAARQEEQTVEVTQRQVEQTVVAAAATEDIAPQGSDHMNSEAALEALRNGWSRGQVQQAVIHIVREFGKDCLQVDLLSDVLTNLNMDNGPDENLPSGGSTDNSSSSEVNASETGPSLLTSVHAPSVPALNVGDNAQTVTAVEAAPEGTASTSRIQQPAAPILDRREVFSTIEREHTLLKERTTCRICHIRPVGCIYLPCGHVIACPNCADNVSHCSFCNKQIIGTANIYLA